MRDPADRGLAQIAGNGGRRDKGKGLAQISKKGTEPPKAVNGGFLAQTGWSWDSEETSEVSGEENDNEKEEHSRDVVSRGGNLAQIGQQSDSSDSGTEELSSEDESLSFLSLAQIGQDSSSSGNENSEDAPHTYPGGSDAEDGGRLAQVGRMSLFNWGNGSASARKLENMMRPNHEVLQSHKSVGCGGGSCLAQIARESEEHTCYEICLEGNFDEKACDEMCSELKHARYDGLAQIGSTKVPSAAFHTSSVDNKKKP